MSSPGDSGPRTDRRSDDASVTASFPAVTETGSGGSRDPWRGVSTREYSGSAGSGRSGDAEQRTEAVPAVAGVGAGAARPSFGDSLPPRPGATTATRPGAGTTATADRRTTARDRAPAAKPARRAQLTLRRFNVWSVFKFSCMLAIALWLVWMIAVGVLYGILDGAGVVGSLNDVWNQLQGSGSGNLVRPGQVLGIAAIVGVVNIVLFIALSSLFAVIYNLVSDFVGGVEVTLSERE